VVQRRQHLGLAVEPHQVPSARHRPIQEHLDRHPPARGLLDCIEHDGLTTPAHLAHHVVAVQLQTWPSVLGRGRVFVVTHRRRRLGTWPGPGRIVVYRSLGRRRIALKPLRTGPAQVFGKLRSFDAAKAMEVPGVVETLVDTYLSLRETPRETFLQTYRRVGMEPFKEALYAEAH